ncbi:A disintegrin and metalloproteinase with thrombospondin motifs 8 [Astyanax mexicanus]|uniref:A disintegrin and metalloproteinase with thrombospondin motifs 8 n=1 Tax=Astyanax mexicanus TaxID=7994 RepID=UPI0020CB503B|nr:A disintegrin and metalloproteinase with thrombospondin motifs 8 [Astyanax mexicanus]
MRACFIAVVLVACLLREALSQQQFDAKNVEEIEEVEEVVPVRLNGGGRVSKRSEEHPRFSLTAFGRTFSLSLNPDDSFISPDMKVYRIRAVDLPESGASEGRQEAKRLRRQVADGVFTSSHPHKTVKTTWESGTELRGCFFTGTVDSSPDSLVAVSLCHGMLGSFIWQGEEFQIEPKRFGSGSSTDQLHLLRRRNFTRTLLGLKSSFGPVDDDGHYSTPCPVTEGKEGTMKESTEDSLETLRDDTDTEVTDSDGQHGTVIDRKLNEGTSSRHRRFVSVPRFVETLVVADASMYRFYGDEIKHYILTLVSVATQLYKHPSIKNSVNIVVVKVLIVEDEEVGPSLSSNGGLALRSFCSWQHLFNPSSQRHPEHFDTAVLFTREDICGHQSCDTLGVADVGTMCDPKRSCSVIEDSGLQAAFTVAHELGHVLSMPHDDSRNCERHFGQMAQNHIMAPVFNGFNRTYPWSPCSAFYITEFFDNGHGDCLLDAPEKTLPLPTDLPGLSYSLELQCQQVFGEGFLFCHNSSATEVCRQLWCQQEGQSVCTTRNGSLPWADGTHCAHGKTCLDGVCTATEEVMKPKVSVDGGWGEWGAWQQCSRSCGGGVMFSYRECDQPTPQNGGSYCRGQRVQYQSCNTQTCESSHGKSFREEQCEKHNNPNHFDIYGNVKQWIPKYAGVSPRDRCKLFCRARSSSEFRVFEAKVIDGTTCGPDTTSVCVQGQCVKAGCDLEIGSNKKFDKCGVCGGDGLSCRKVSGSFNKVSRGYSDIVTIPIGATNIDIKQRSHGGVKHDGSYLAVKQASGEYLLNGNFSVSTVEQDIPARGAVLKYSGSATTLERIQSFRQLQEVLVIQLLSTAAETNPPKVKYTFFIPKGVTFNKPKEKSPSAHVIHPFGVPQWVLGEWSECSKSCGSGWSRRTVECKDNAGFYSNHCDKDLKPTDIRPCADLPCPMWQIGPWSSCSRTCGRGERRRSVLCIDYTGKDVEKEKCDPSKQPKAVSEECMYQDCLELPDKQDMDK